jgi:PleD family two-component response regulator
MGTDLSLKDAMAAGANDVLVKPFIPNNINQAIENATQLLSVQRRLNDPSEDFPSGGGVIAKSAFCQLFLSALDRADRYAEQSYVMFMSLRNYNQLRVNDSDRAADTAAATLAQQLVRIRRQSDILSQTGKHEYALLLQRPLYATEPMDAAMRFADTLSASPDLLATSKAPVELLVTLMEAPSGHILARHEITVRAKTA